MSWEKCKGQELIAEELKLVQGEGCQVRALGHGGVCASAQGLSPGARGWCL